MLILSSSVNGSPISKADFLALSALILSPPAEPADRGIRTQDHSIDRMQSENIQHQEPSPMAPPDNSPISNLTIKSPITVLRSA